MTKRRTTIEWSVIEDDAAWQNTWPAASVPTAPVPSTPHSGQHPGERRLLVPLALLFILLASGWAWQRQQRLATLEGELHATLVRAASQRPAIDTALPNPPIAATAVDAPSRAPSAPAVQIHDYQIQADRAMAQVLVRYPGSANNENDHVAGDLVYRETHFYQQTADGWQPIAPDLDLLGPIQTYETTHLTIRYRAVDAAAIRAAAPRLDQRYAQLRREFGLPTSTSPPIAVEVIPARVPGGSRIDYGESAITIPSPALLSVPAGWSPETVFYQSLVYPLADLAVTEIENTYPSIWRSGRTRWRPVMQALRLWTVWESDGPLAVWRTDVVRWLVRNAQSPTTDAHAGLPAAYIPLCRAYQVWDLSPWEMSIPLFCSQVDETMWSSWNYPHLPTRLNDLTSLDEHMPPPADSMGSMVASMVALETVLEYIVARYGQERLPDFLAALSEHSYWEKMIPDLFGISADEFESDWRAFLAKTYGDGRGFER